MYKTVKDEEQLFTINLNFGTKMVKDNTTEYKTMDNLLLY